MIAQIISTQIVTCIMTLKANARVAFFPIVVLGFTEGHIHSSLVTQNSACSRMLATLC